MNRPLRSILAIVPLMSLASACAGAHTGRSNRPTEVAEQKAAESGVDLSALLAQELAPQPLQTIAAADGSFKARMEGSGAPEVVAKEGFTQIELPFGESAILCFVYPGQQDLGNLVRTVGNLAFEDGTKHEWVDVHGDQVEGKGYVVGRAHYLDEKPEGNELGDLKVLASTSDDAGAVCIHDAAGMYASFERAGRGFVASLTMKGASKKARPLEVSITRGQIPGRMVSLSRAVESRQGKVKTNRKLTTTLVIDGDGKLGASDDGTVETFEKGALDSGVYMSAADGELVYQLALTRESAGYKVAGTVKTQPFATAFAADAGLVDDDRRAAEVCKVRSGKAREVTVVDYDPSVDMARPSSTLVEKSGKADSDVRLRVQGAEDAQMLLRLDERCDVAGGSIQVGPVSVQVERIYHQKSKG